MYKLLRSFLFLFDPEQVHYFSMNALRRLCSVGFIRKIIQNQFNAGKGKPVNFLSLSFKNPVGLGAGFDKNAAYLNELETLGFGFVEIGTVTPLPQHGNEKPRLFRLPKDKALINRMGFNNDGAEAIADRLEKWRKQSSHTATLIIGGNIGKNKNTPNEDAWLDYEKCFMALHPYVDYFVVNVSSPNTPGLRALQEKDALHKILFNLQQKNKEQEIQKPILLKIAPDLTMEQIDDVIELAMEIKLDGLVATNTTIDRQTLRTNSKVVEKIGAGGVSGLPVKKRSTEIVTYICEKTNGLLPVIASGGIFTGADAKDKLDAGAGLVQVWTGFIYEGPAIVKNICKAI
jgi:dihydroorotate dehydrogenase